MYIITNRHNLFVTHLPNRSSSQSNVFNVNRSISFPYVECFSLRLNPSTWTWLTFYPSSLFHFIFPSPFGPSHFWICGVAKSWKSLSDSQQQQGPPASCPQMAFKKTHMNSQRSGGSTSHTVDSSWGRECGGQMFYFMILKGFDVCSFSTSMHCSV